MKDKKFSLVESIFAFLIVIPLDMAEALFGLVGLGIFLTFLDVGVWFLFLIWFWLKGGHAGRTVVRLLIWAGGNIAELMPIVEIMPIRTLTTAVVIKMFNSKREQEALKQEQSRESENE